MLFSSADVDRLEDLTETHFGPIDAPTALEILNGVLVISGHTRVYLMEFAVDGSVASITTTDITMLHSSSMTSHDGVLYFAEQDGSILSLDATTGVASDVLTVHQVNSCLA